MLEVWQAIWPYRVAAGALFFVTLGALDWARHREDPRRAKEYVFLGFAMALAIAYGVAHDQLTATISRDCFWRGKELARLAALPLAGAAACAAAGGALFALDPFGLEEIALELSGRTGPLRFLVAWGMHAGSYAGAVVGTIAAVVIVRRRRTRPGGSLPAHNDNRAVRHDNRAVHNEYRYATGRPPRRPPSLR